MNNTARLRLFYTDAGTHPVIGKLYYPRQEVIDGDEAPRYQRYIANTLSKIARSPEDCETILTHVASVESGAEADFEIEGNDVLATVSTSGVQIDILANDNWVGQPDGRFSLTEFRNAIGAWREFLRLPESTVSEIVRDL